MSCKLAKFYKFHFLHTNDHEIGRCGTIRERVRLAHYADINQQTITYLPISNQSHRRH